MPSKELWPARPGGITSLNIIMGNGEKPDEKLAKLGISLHKREKGSIESFPGTFSVLFPRD